MRTADDATLHQLADQFDTPLYVYDLDEIDDRVTSLRRALPAAVDIAYAVKANPSLGVLARVAELGLGADIASAGELEVVRRAGFDPSSVVFTGPGKRDDELDEAVRCGLRAVTVESIGELERLIAVARRHGRRVPVLLRTAGLPGSDEVLVGSGSGKFGMRQLDLNRAARLAASAAEIELLGLHAFHASNVLDANELLDHAERTLATAAKLAWRTGIRFTLVDIGGGLGIPYAHEDRPLDISYLGHGLGRLVNRWQANPAFHDLRLLVEPGRYLVGPAGIYLARVIDVKRADEGMVAIIDGGIHHLLRPALVGQPQRLRLVSLGRRRTRRVPLTIAGPLCTGLDVLCRRVELPLPETGDLVAVLDAGAYGFTESMPLFLSHPTPAEVVRDRGRPRLSRRRLDPTELLDLQARA